MSRLHCHLPFITASGSTLPHKQMCTRISVYLGLYKKPLKSILTQPSKRSKEKVNIEDKQELCIKWNLKLILNPCDVQPSTASQPAQINMGFHQGWRSPIKECLYDHQNHTCTNAHTYFFIYTVCKYMPLKKLFSYWAAIFIIILGSMILENLGQPHLGLLLIVLHK